MFWRLHAQDLRLLLVCVSVACCCGLCLLLFVLLYWRLHVVDSLVLLHWFVRLWFVCGVLVCIWCVICVGCCWFLIAAVGFDLVLLLCVRDWFRLDIWLLCLCYCGSVGRVC